MSADLSNSLQAETNPEITLDKTLAIFKSVAIKKEVSLVDILSKACITVTNRRFVKLSREQAMEFYRDRKDEDGYEELVEDLCRDIVLVMVFAKTNIVDMWREIVKYPMTKDTQNNLAKKFWEEVGSLDDVPFHASETKCNAEWEIRFFFPNTITEPIRTAESARYYLSKNVLPTLLSCLTEVCKRKPLDPIMFLSDSLLRNNPNQPRTYGEEEDKC
nr:nucleoside diphosphate kinase 5 [Hymenolepis microstoma]